MEGCKILELLAAAISYHVGQRNLQLRKVFWNPGVHIQGHTWRGAMLQLQQLHLAQELQRGNTCSAGT